MIFRMQAWSVVRYILLVIFLALAVLVVAAAILFIGLDLAYANHVFKGIYVEEIYVGSLSREEAVKKLSEELNLETLNSDLVLEFEGHTWSLPLYEIDAYVDLEATVDKAVEAGWDVPFYQRWARRAAFKGVNKGIDLVIHYDSHKLDSWLSKLEGTINREAINAEIKLQGGRLVFQRSQEGWILEEDYARESILESLSSMERVVTLEIEVTKPEVSDDQVGKVITVDRTNHILTLYNNMEIEKSYPIACGSATWPTPGGTFKVTSKQRNPSWINPGTPWAESMPDVIPPGPGNPLGTRAIGTSASGVFIHGTYSSWSIGRSVSHGCIRMYIKDSEDLFPRVEVGIPVLIY
ncbi:MAG: L,D-transpeptidase/peptidoglycan binding protein [Actinomycetota bacterium]|nr:L,D-transpeptidase/peptidoglycan binding protein [Actinomycetota bacterium]